MALKFVLIVALACAAQGFSVESKLKACKPVADVDDIPHELEEAIDEFDEVRDTISIATMEAYFKGADPAVVIACFREQKGNYIRLGQRIAGLMRSSSMELAKDLGDKYEKFAKQAEGPIRTIAITMKTLPRKVWLLIKEQEFGQALEVMRESRRVVRENAIALARVMKELRGELPEVAEKAEKMARQIRMEAKKGIEVIEAAFRKCVEEGGPKRPENPEKDSEEDEVQDEFEF